MNKQNILFIWEVPKRLQNYISDGLIDSDVNLIFPNPANKENYLSIIEDVDIIVGWRPTKDLLKKAKRLKAVINPGAGVQHLIELFSQVNRNRTSDIILCNGHSNSYFTAQHAVALLLSISNKIVQHHNWMVKGKWRKGDNFAKSYPLLNRNIGLLGIYL